MEHPPSGIIMDFDSSLSLLAARLKMAESEVLRLMLDLVRRITPAHERVGPPAGIQSAEP